MAYISDQPAVGQAVPLADYAEPSEPLTDYAEQSEP